MQFRGKTQDLESKGRMYWGKARVVLTLDQQPLGAKKP